MNTIWFDSHLLRLSAGVCISAFRNTPFAGVFVSVYTVAAFVLAYFSTMKKGSLVLNPFNLPAVGASVASISHIAYADVCSNSNFAWVTAFISCCLFFIIGVGSNDLNKDKDISKPYHKIMILLAFFAAVGSCVFFVNTAFDRSEPITVKTKITETVRIRGGGSTFLVSTNEQAYSASLSFQILHVSNEAFEYYETGDTVSVSVKKGALGINYCRFVEDGYTGESIWEAF